MDGKSRKILLYSTLNPYPFWAGSGNLWFDFVRDDRVNSHFEFHTVLADSPVTRKKARILAEKGIKTTFYKHFNVNFARRNLYRLADKIGNRKARTLPWFDKIKKEKCDLVWFNVAGLADLQDLLYAARICQQLKIPYWLLLQHGYEDFFPASQRESEAIEEVTVSAKRFVFIAEKNRLSLERAIARRLENAFHTVNSIPADKIAEAKRIGEGRPVGSDKTARFFNLGRYSSKDKAQHLLLEALAGDDWKNRDWQLSFIGVSDFGASYLEKLIGFYGLNRKKIQILPHMENVFEAIAETDVLLMPSLAEGTPFAMIESMACGRPALGTPVGGIPELIIENQTGWLTRTTHVRDISEKLEQAWHQREKWQELGKNAQKHIETNFNQETVFAQLLKVLIADSGY